MTTEEKEKRKEDIGIYDITQDIGKNPYRKGYWTDGIDRRVKLCRN